MEGHCRAPQGPRSHHPVPRRRQTGRPAPRRPVSSSPCSRPGGDAGPVCARDPVGASTDDVSLVGCPHCLVHPATAPIRSTVSTTTPQTAFPSTPQPSPYCSRASAPAAPPAPGGTHRSVPPPATRASRIFPPKPEAAAATRLAITEENRRRAQTPDCPSSIAPRAPSDANSAIPRSTPTRHSPIRRNHHQPGAHPIPPPHRPRYNTIRYLPMDAESMPCTPLEPNSAITLEPEAARSKRSRISDRRVSRSSRAP